MAHVNQTWFAALFAALLFLGVQACTDSNFAGGAAGKSAGLTGKDKGKDGADSGPDTGEPDSGEPDASDGADGSGDGGSAGKDAGGGEGDDSGSEGADSGSEGADDSGGFEGSDESDGDPADEDGEVTSKYRHDAVITRGEHETPFQLKIETIVKGKSVSSVDVDFGDNGDQQTVKNVCRNNKDTCFKLTFTNKDDNDENGHVEVVGGTPNAVTTCAWAQESGNSAIIDVDMDGDEQSGIFDMGTCKAEDQDDQITITCPQSKKLNVQLCTGG